MHTVLVAVQVRKPDDASLAFLLGLALGVMATLSIVELWIKNGLEHGFFAISVALAGGVLLYYVAQPFFPEFEVRAQKIAENRHPHSSSLKPAYAC
jgi:zinc transporter, ZIP family